MSVKIMAQVWELDLPAHLKLTALALADWADDDGDRIFPSVGRLASKVGLSERAAQYHLRQLEGLRILQVVELGGGRQTSRYRLHPSNGKQISTRGADPAPVQPIAPLDPSRGDPGFTPAVQPIAPNPLEEPSTKTEPPVRVLPATRNVRPRNPIWDALSSWFGEPETPGETKLRGRIVADLVAAGATPGEIERRVENWPMLYEGATLTETALLKHWTALGRPPLRATSTQIADVADRRRREKLLSDAAAQDAARARGLSNGEPTTPPRGGEARRQR